MNDYLSGLQDKPRNDKCQKGPLFRQRLSLKFQGLPTQRPFSFSSFLSKNGKSQASNKRVTGVFSATLTIECYSVTPGPGHHMCTGLPEMPLWSRPCPCSKLPTVPNRPRDKVQAPHREWKALSYLFSPTWIPSNFALQAEVLSLPKINIELVLFSPSPLLEPGSRVLIWMTATQPPNGPQLPLSTIQSIVYRAKLSIRPGPAPLSSPQGPELVLKASKTGHLPTLDPVRLLCLLPLDVHSTPPTGVSWHHELPKLFPALGPSCMLFSRARIPLPQTSFFVVCLFACLLWRHAKS